MTFLYFLSNIIFVIGVILLIKSRMDYKRWYTNKRDYNHDWLMMEAIFGTIFSLASVASATLWLIMGVDDRYFPLIRLVKRLGLTFYQFLLTVKDDPVKIVGIVFGAAIIGIIILAIKIIKEEKQKEERRKEKEERMKYW